LAFQQKCLWEFALAAEFERAEIFESGPSGASGSDSRQSLS
jgi:hypothetical protein